MLCEICKATVKNFQSLAAHLRYNHTNINNKQYYDSFLIKEKEGLCLYCMKSTKFKNLGFGYWKHCSHKCQKTKYNLNDIVEIFEKENYKLVNFIEFIDLHQQVNFVCPNNHNHKIKIYLFIYGHRCRFCVNKNIKHSYEYIKQYFEEKDHKLISTEYKNNNNYLDVICPNNHTFKIKFNDFYQGHGCSICAVQKRKDTCLEKYGVENPMQNDIIFSKSMKIRYKFKKVITPSGKEIYLQGYEPQVYAQLLEKYTEEEIKFQRTDIPTIWYELNSKKHRYYPDFFIPKDNLLIEVKSNWTYNLHKNINLLKKEACLDQGFEFQFMVL